MALREKDKETVTTEPISVSKVTATPVFNFTDNVSFSTTRTIVIGSVSFTDVSYYSDPTYTY